MQQEDEIKPIEDKQEEEIQKPKKDNDVKESTPSVESSEMTGQCHVVIILHNYIICIFYISLFLNKYIPIYWSQTKVSLVLVESIAKIGRC